jgi:hypothetical protein
MDESLCRQLSALIVELYNQISKNYTIDEHKHYIITPKSLLEMFKNLTIYEYNDLNGLL